MGAGAGMGPAVRFGDRMGPGVRLGDGMESRAGATLGDGATSGDDTGVWVLLRLMERAASWACRRLASARQSNGMIKLLLSVMCSRF